jgi:hypothetical protein
MGSEMPLIREIAGGPCACGSTVEVIIGTTAKCPECGAAEPCTAPPIDTERDK